MTDSPRKPRAVRLDQTKDRGPQKQTTQGRKPRAQKNLSELVPIPDEAAQTPAGEANDAVFDALTPPPTILAKKSFSFAKLLLIAFAGLISLGIGLTLDQLIRTLFERNSWLGWVATGLTLLGVVAAMGIAIREFIGMRRLRSIEKLRNRAKELLEGERSTKDAGALIDQLMDLYESHPDTARGRAKMQSHHGEVIDGPDLIKLAERDLISPLDDKARELVMNAAKRVSIVTAASPRAIIDLAYVVVENMRLIRQLSELYGGRPGTFGMIKLARNVVTHLAVTGSIAIGDGLIQQFVGHGLAARISTRLGEGVVNGLLTARVGISAIDLCRPLPFISQSRPGVSDFLSDLVKFSGDKEEKQS